MSGRMGLNGLKLLVAHVVDCVVDLLEEAPDECDHMGLLLLGFVPAGLV